MRPKLLVVDDEKNTRDALRRALEDDFEVFVAANVESSKNLMKSEPMDVVLTDLRLGNESGLDVLKLCQRQNLPPPCVVMTAYGSVESAVGAMRQGAYDYVTKPLDLEHTQLLLQRAVRTVQVEQENVHLKAQLERSFGLDRILGKSAAIEKVLDRVRQVADSKASVLLEGESGTGKELVARALHGLSSRKGGPFVAVHCAALSPQLLESELFGHEKGSFTGATERRIGRFEQAQGGTIFLDEIGEIDVATQVKLLRVLGERTLERVSGRKSIDQCRCSAHCGDSSKFRSFGARREISGGSLFSDSGCPNSDTPFARKARGHSDFGGIFSQGVQLGERKRGPVFCS